jgi:pimeloyl-ACP methyl ester carboxylesterase
LVEFDNSGHMPFLEEPKKFNREMEAFLAEIG